VPFLIELLRDEDAPDRDGLALLLASIAAGSGYLEAHLTLDSEREAAVEEARKAGKTLDAEVELERAYVRAARISAEPALALLGPFLDHEDGVTRSSVAEAFGCYPARAEELLPPLRAALEREVDDEVRDAMRRSILRLTGKGAEVEAEDAARQDAIAADIRKQVARRRWRDVAAMVTGLAAATFVYKRQYLAAAAMLGVYLLVVWLLEIRPRGA